MKFEEPDTEILEKDKWITFDMKHILGKLEGEVVTGVQHAERRFREEYLLDTDKGNFYSHSKMFPYFCIWNHVHKNKNDWIKKVVSKFNEEKSTKILDYGGGIGLDSVLLCREKLMPIYVDILGKHFEIARELFRLQFAFPDKMVGWVPLLRFNEIAESSCDGAICYDVLGWVSDPNVALENIHYAVKDGGLVFVEVSEGYVLKDFNGKVIDSNFPKGFKDLKSLMELNGFEYVEEGLYRVKKDEVEE